MVTVIYTNVSKQPIEMFEPIQPEKLKNALLMVAREYSVEIDVELDQFKVTDGAIGSGIFAASTPCVVVYHKQKRKKYHSLVLEQKSTYGRHYMYVHMGGTSANMRNIRMGQESFSFIQGDIMHHRPGIIGKALSSSGHKGMQDEELYYDVMYEVIGAAMAKATTMANIPSQEPPKAQPSPKAAPKAQPTPRATASAPKAAPSAPKAAPKAAPQATGSPSFFANLGSSRGSSNSTVPAATPTPAPVTHNANGSQDIAARLALRGQATGTLFKNEAALQQFHPQIYATLMDNPIYRSAPKTDRADLTALANVLERYSRSRGVASCSFGRNFPTSFAYFARQDVYVLYWGPVAPNGTFSDNGYVVTGDWFCQFTQYKENFRISLSEIRSITKTGNQIYINNQPLLFDNHVQEQYDLLVYTIGTLLSMKYPGNTAISTGSAHTGTLSSQQQSGQMVDGTYRFVNPKLKK